MSRADKLDEDEEDEILTVDADGQVEIHSTSRMSNRSYTIEEKVSVNESETTFEEPVIILLLIFSKVATTRVDLLCIELMLRLSHFNLMDSSIIDC